MRYSTYRAPLGYTLTPWVKRLLIANTVIFLITLVNPPFFYEWFGFSPAHVLTRPWGAVTYMFIHGGFLHLFLNMLVLFFFGPPLEAKWGSTEFIKYYIICGLGGVALSFLFASYSIIGASAAIYGVMLAFAMNWPNAPVYIWGVLPVKAKWLVGFFFAVSLMSAAGGVGGGIAHFAHLGGILTGFLYLKREWRPHSAKGQTKDPRARRLAIVPREERRKERRSMGAGREKQNGKEETLLDEVDRILDKISSEGMGALTSEERRTLDEVSRRHRTN